jgi:thioredoxin reductase
MIHKLPQSADADWLIVGAGPAGIAVIGVLIDIGVDPERIAWIDPEFNVGRIGPYYSEVLANTKIRDFVGFINACNIFKECNDPAVVALRERDLDQYDKLGVVIEPLRALTRLLQKKVHALKDTMTALYFENDLWHITTQNNKQLSACNVVLATGSRPRTLDYDGQEVIPLDVALDPYNLQAMLTSEDVVGVVGASHSAILLLKFLSDLTVKHIYNFYKNPLIYAVDMGDWVMNASAGLKGPTAQWAKNVLEKNPPANLTRIKSTPETLERMIPQCSKMIYAIGYERNPLPLINNEKPIVDYDNETGYIAPRLFGIGIAFPEKMVDKIGVVGTCIGIDCFMDYAQAIIPQWIDDPVFKQLKREMARRQVNVYKKMSDLFTIYDFS